MSEYNSNFLDQHKEMQIYKLKFLCKLINQKTTLNTNTIALENIESWSGKLIETDSEFAGDAVEFQKNDVLFGKLRPYLAKTYLAESNGEAFGDIYVMRPNERITPSFLKYLFLSKELIDLIDSSTYGTKMPRANWDFIGNTFVKVPVISRQNKIIEFLDLKNSEIDQAIAIKEQQIALLNERKQIVIQKAVTQGLDPNVPMKDSGVEWIGEIPEHWEIRANRTMFKERNEQGKEGLPLLSVSIHSGVSNEEISEEDNVRGRVKIEDKSKYILVKKGDIAFNMMRAWQGGIGAVSVDGMVSPAYIVAKPNDFINSEFFEYQYRCPEFIQQMDRYSKGITDFRKRLYWDGFKQLLTVVPPIDEQLKIVEQIKAIEQQTNVATQIKNQQIEKLKEYKTTLINDAVTGKIKVA